MSVCFIFWPYLGSNPKASFFYCPFEAMRNRSDFGINCRLQVRRVGNISLQVSWKQLWLGRKKWHSKLRPCPAGNVLQTAELSDSVFEWWSSSWIFERSNVYTRTLWTLSKDRIWPTWLHRKSKIILKWHYWFKSYGNIGGGLANGGILQGGWFSSGTVCYQLG